MQETGVHAKRRLKALISNRFQFCNEESETLWKRSANLLIVIYFYDYVTYSVLADAGRHG